MTEADAKKKKIYVPTALKLKVPNASLVDFIGDSAPVENKEKGGSKLKPPSKESSKPK